MKAYPWFFGAAVVLWSVWASAGAIQIEAPTFEIFEKKASELSAKHGASQVLLVFDIDNTLLTMKTHLGSDQWFGWQAGLIHQKESEYTKGRVGTSFEELLLAQGLLYSVAGMQPTEPTLPRRIHELQKKGHPAFVLTARGPEYKFDTLREFYRNGYSFEESAPKIQESDVKNPARHWLLYEDTATVKKYGFSSDEAVRFHLDKKSQDMGYWKGVVFSSGQHKGAVLRILLKKMQLDPKAILFIDDYEKNTNGMVDAFASSKADVTVFRYSGMDAKIGKFVKSSKEDVIRQWNELNRAHQERDPSRVNKIIEAVF